MTSPEPLPEVPAEPDAPPHQLLTLAAAAIVGGLLAGVVGAAFRWTLFRADEVRMHVVEWGRQWPHLGIVAPILAAALAVFLARLIVRWVPTASGSGVQRIEGAMRDQLPLEPKRTVPAKFVGGVLAMGSGLALGREGPTVQMGAAVGSGVGHVAKLDKPCRADLEAALAGAGLAVAFNAPTGGSIFVFEELTRAFRLRLVVATLVGTATAILVSRWMLGDSPEFQVVFDQTMTAAAFVAFGVFGALMGVAGAVYNRTVVWFLDVMTGIPRLAPEVKAACVGALVGALAWFVPNLVGGGELITERMLSTTPLLVAAAGILVFRWLLGALSYSIGTPGGLFAPLLAVGATAGSLFAVVANLVIPDLDLSPTQFAFVGMSSMFAGVVRAPLTGVVIAAEMAATTQLLPPALLAGALAVVTATLLGSEPIYDTLRLRNVREAAKESQPDG